MNTTFIVHPIFFFKVETFYVLFILWSTEYWRSVVTRPVISQNKKIQARLGS